MLNRLKPHLTPNRACLLFLFAVVASLCIANYQPGTILSGWDTLHPEFNRLEYISRAIFGAYEPHQGLGAASSQSHAAELPRLIFYIPLSYILPLSFVRYSYFFLTMFAGVFGMYFFMMRVVFESVKRKAFSVKGEENFPLESHLSATFASLFYLLNLGTLQHFYTPLEMFPTHFAALPWLFLTAILFLEKGGRKNLLFFAFATFFASPMAHTATLWYAYFLCLGGYLVFFLLLESGKQKTEYRRQIIEDRKTETIPSSVLSAIRPLSSVIRPLFIFRSAIFKRVLLLLSLSLLLNLYWILPNIYFALYHGAEITKTKINTLFTDEAFLKNVEFSNFADLALLKSFPFDWGKYIGNNQFAPLLDTWIAHLNNPLVPAIGYSFFVVAILGMARALRKRLTYIIPFFMVTLICVFFLLTTHPPFGFLFSAVQKNIPLFEEAFRFPFTKFSLPLIFCFSVFSGVGIKVILSSLKKFFNQRISLIAALFVFLSLVFYMLPAFNGNFISPSMKVKIPKEYFVMFSWFQNNADRGRIATFPVETFWNWDYYSWGYQGAGFSYFGIPQPILEREFDRWNIFNEQYYQEISYAVYSGNVPRLKNVIQKYDIHYLLLDTDIVVPGVDPTSLYFDRSKKMFEDLETQGIVSKPVTFGNHLFAYHVEKSRNYPIDTVKKTFLVEPQRTSSFEDYAYGKFGDYIVDPENTTQGSALVFPLRNFIDNNSRINQDILTIKPDSIDINLPRGKPYSLAEPLRPSEIIPSRVLVELKDGGLILTLYPEGFIFNSTKSGSPVSVTLPVPPDSESFDLSINGQLFPFSGLSQNTPLALGTAYLSSRRENSVSLFDDKPTVVPLLAKVNPIFSYCKYDQYVSGGIKASVSNDKITLSKVLNYPVCIEFPLNFLKDLTDQTAGENLVSFSFNYNGASRLLGCIKAYSESTCNRFAILQENGTKKTFFFSVSPNDAVYSELILELDPSSRANDVFSNLGLSVNQSRASMSLPPDFLANLNPAQIQPFQNVSLPKNSFIDSGKSVLSQIRTLNDCPFKLGGNNGKKILTQDSFGNTIEYISEKGSFCDHFSYEHLPHTLGYLVLIESKNVEGLPLNLCITNYTSKRCDVYSKLSTGSAFHTDTFFLPPSGSGNGYDVNFENLGIPGTRAENFIRALTIIPYDASVLEKIYTVRSGNAGNDLSSGRIIATKMYNPLQFMATTNGKPALLTLSYSYEPNFRAYEVNCSGTFSCIIATFMSPLFGHEVKQHVIVNNWENGWILPNSQLSTLNSQIAIVFLPQYLEYLGFVVLLITFNFLLNPVDKFSKLLKRFLKEN
jgi:hypothetical protein